MSFFALPKVVFSQACDPSTPVFNIDLTGAPDSIWHSPPVSRDGHCCAASGSDRCIEFNITLDPGSSGIQINLISGALPTGALFYEIDCANPTQIGDTLCLDGVGPHKITFCKPGNNNNVYEIVSLKEPSVSPPITVSDGCQGLIYTVGYDETTIEWKPIPYDTSYLPFMSCLSGCDSVDIIVNGRNYPPFIDFEVSGYREHTLCDTARLRDTVRVYFVSDKTVDILPANPVVCFGGINTTITANATGGAPPYTYLWSTGETTQSIDVGVGTYWVEVFDTTNCPTVLDTVVVTAHLSPISVNAGADASSCTNLPTASLSGSVNVAHGGIWSGGNGTYSPNNTSLNLNYTPTPSEIIAGTVTLTLTTTGNDGCPAESDNVTITIEPAPTIDAGPNQVVCGDEDLINLTGSFTNAGGVAWSGGNGTFGNPNNPITTYVPNSADTAAGVITLTLTTINPGACNPVSDIVNITFTDVPKVNAGSDKTVCKDVSSVSLAGIITVASGGTWTTSGTGTFSPNANSLTASYIPSTADKSAGSITLTLTSTGNGNCNAYSDQLVINFYAAPTVNVGPDLTRCSDVGSVTINPTTTNATSYSWSTSGSGIFAPNNTTPSITYTPSNTDTANGTVTLTLTVSSAGCSSYSDNLVLTLTDVPSANAGLDISTCKDVSSVALSGLVSVASGGIWTTSGTGSFSPNATSLTGNYIPSGSDASNGSVTLTLTTTGNGLCNAYNDDVLITFTDIPTVDAGSNETICADAAGITLSGAVTIASGGIWSTSGTGTFNPNSTNLGATYIPSAADITAGSVTLTLTSTGNGLCQSYNDQKIITINPKPTVNAGVDKTVCADQVAVTLNGSVTNATGGIWSTSGTGTFSPNATTLNASYIPSAADDANGSVTLTLTTTGNDLCQAYNDQMIITINPQPTVNAGNDITTCKDIASVPLTGVITIATGGLWTTSGTGTFSPNATTLTASYIPSAADTTNGSVTLTLTTTGNGLCQAYNDQVTINFTDVPTVHAGSDETICADATGVTLGGVITVATGGIWTSSGTGTFSPNNTTLGATYVPSAADITAGSVTLTLTTSGNGACQSYSDQLIITINPKPVVSANVDRTVCADQVAVTLNGSVTNATGGIWTTSGTGTFSPNATTLNASYIPSAADDASGSVTLTLTTTGNGLCNAYNDQMIITINPQPTVTAGVDQTICADAAGVTLSGVITVATGGIWTSSGTGTFSPNNTTLGATYVPSAADITAGSVTLTLTTTGNGLCQTYNDQMIITINPKPIVSASVDQTVCADQVAVTLNGSVTNATGGIWSTSGTGTFSPNATTLNASYIPSTTDDANGSVTLTLTTTGNGLCNAYNDQMIITINPQPTVTAGVDQTICADAAGVTLSGVITVASGGAWTSSGTGTFSPNNTDLDATYVPSAADITAGSVTLTLTTTGNGLCNAYNDQMIITINPKPIVNAGVDRTVCADQVSVILNGSVTNATGGIWSTSGTGTFSPNSTTLNASYIPSTADDASGSVTLTLTTTGNGLCNAYNDQMIITINPQPTVNAGVDKTVCADQVAVVLNGSVTNATGGIWSTSGTGTFSPNATTLNASYIPSAADDANGSVTLTLTTTGNGLCQAYNDQMIITINPQPTVNAGNDITTCKDIASVPLTGVITVATGGLWTTSGTGTFSPNATTLTASYIPSTADTTNGSVTLTLTTTGNGLCQAYNDQVTINFTDLPRPTAGNDQTVCADISAVSLSGGVSIASGGIWTSSGTGAFTPNSSNLNANYIPSAADINFGSVTLTLTTTGNGACQSYNDQTLVTILPAPISFAGNDTSICITNPTVPLHGAVQHAGGGIWSTSGSGTFTPNNTTLNATYNPSIADQAGGNINIYLTTTGNGLCNPVKDTMVLTITPLNITVNAGIDSLVCGDDSTPVYGLFGGAQGVVWSTLGDGNFNGNSTSANTTYFFGANDALVNSVELVLTTTGNGGCLAQSDTLLISIQDPLELSLIVEDSTCRNGSTFSVGSSTSTGSGFWWNNGDGQFSNINALNTSYTSGTNDTTSSGIMVYFTTNNNGVCSALTDSVFVNYVNPPSINFTANAACLNDATILTDQTTATGGITNWIWTIDNTITDNNQNTSVVLSNFGTHTVELWAESGYGCIDSLTQSVIVHSLPEADFTENAKCYVDSVTLFDASTIATGTNTNWEWDVFNVDQGVGPSITVAFDSAGTYSFELIVTSNFGCTDTIIGSLDVRPNPIAAFYADSVCLNDSTFFNDLSTVEFGFIESWSWNFGNGTDTLQNPNNIFGSDGQHDVTLIVTSNIGCSDTLIQSIVINPLPNVAYSYIGFCEEDEVLFSDETTIASGAVESWEWDLNGTTSFDQNPSYGFGSQGNYQVSLIAGSNLGCYDTLVQTVTISPNPTAEFTSDVPVSQILDDVHFTDQSIDASVWFWDFGDTLGVSSSQNPTYAYNNFGQYQITLVIENQFGCTDSVSHPITIKQPPLAPSGFSPNADGLNDNFNILGGYFIEFKLDIYNNWGKMIFTTTDPNEGWDGTHEGLDQPMGVYVYLYQVKTEDNVEYSGHGDVTLMR